MIITLLLIKIIIIIIICRRLLLHSILRQNYFRYQTCNYGFCSRDITIYSINKLLNIQTYIYTKNMPFFVYIICTRYCSVDKYTVLYYIK